MFFFKRYNSKKTHEQLINLFNSIWKGKRVSTKLTTTALKSKKIIKAQISSFNNDIAQTFEKKRILLGIKKTGIMPGRVKWINTPKQFESQNWCLNNIANSRTCHVKCDAWFKGVCKVFDWDMKCRICGFHKSKHKFEKKYWGWDIKYDYAECKENRPLNTIKEELLELEIKLYGKLGSIVKLTQELNQIALKPIKCSTQDYMDELHEIANKTKQNEDVLQFLLDLKKEKNIMCAIDKYIQSLNKEKIKFSDLNFDELEQYYIKITNIVKKYIEIE